MTDAIVIVGAGQGGVSAARTLRGEGFDGPVVLIGDEDQPPYQRPPLSKDYLRGQGSREDLLIQPRAWYQEAGIELRTGTAVTSLDTAARRVRLADGDTVPYGRLLLATGGRPRTPPGGAGGRIRCLRSLADADWLRAELPAARHLIVIGAGFIGAETAASARQLGVEVTMLELLDVPLARVLGPEIGAVYAGIHRDHGVRLRTGEGVESVTESPGGAVRVRTTRGADMVGDLVIAGVGITPDAGLAEAAGIATGNGVLVDEFCRTSEPGVYAAGDVANHVHPLFGRRLRVEHDDSAIRHGAAAARSMLGRDTPFDECHWFWSDQYDLNLQYTGDSGGWDQVVIRGSLPDRQFTAFYLGDGVLRAALAINRPKDILRARKLIRARHRPDPAKLADEDTDLRTV